MACAAFWVGVGADRARAETLAFTLDEARIVAREAYRRGNVELANALSHKLVEAQPRDTSALVMLAATEPLLGRAGSGREAGKLAFRLSDNGTVRREAAYYTSRAAMADKRYGAAQYWLRRAYQLSDTEAQRDRIASAFSEVRRASPWSARVSFNLSPSTNVNGGSSTEYLLIDDVEAAGRLSGSALALSGVTFSVSGALDYAISRGSGHRTKISLHGYRNFNTLSQEAKDLAPNARGSDFDYALGEIELTHALARAWGPLPDRYALALGQTWYGGSELERVGRITLSKRFRLGQEFSARITGEAERRLSDRDAQDRDGTELKFDLSRRVGAAGHLISLSYAITEVRSDDQNADYSGQSVTVGFTMGDDIMGSGVRLSGDVGWSGKDYDRYKVGFIQVPGGRSDSTVSGSLNLHLDRVDYMGFTPVLSLNGRGSTSNISRFEGESLGLSMGIRSAF